MRYSSLSLAAGIAALALLAALALSSCSTLGLGHEYRGQYVSNILLDPPNPGPGDLVKITVTEVFDRDPRGIYPGYDPPAEVSVSGGTLFQVRWNPDYELPGDWGTLDAQTLTENKDRWEELQPFAAGTLGYALGTGGGEHLIWRAPETAQQVRIMAGYFYSETPSEPGENGCQITVDVQ